MLLFVNAKFYYEKNVCAIFVQLRNIYHLFKKSLPQPYVN